MSAHVYDLASTFGLTWARQPSTHRVSRHPPVVKEDGPVRIAREGTTQGNSPNKANLTARACVGSWQLNEFARNVSCISAGGQNRAIKFWEPVAL